MTRLLCYNKTVRKLRTDRITPSFRLCGDIRRHCMGNFFYKLRCAMARFMYGRNGVDQLSWAMIVLGVALSLIGSLVGIPLVMSILSYVNLAIWIMLLYRMFSRNLEKRRRENARFMAWWGPKQNALRGARARRKDKTHKYVRCACGTYCRVPRGVGRVELTCPKCGAKKIVNT